VATTTNRGEETLFGPEKDHEPESSESSRREKAALATTSGRDEPQLSPRVASTSPPPYARHARGLIFQPLTSRFHVPVHSYQFDVTASRPRIAFVV